MRTFLTVALLCSLALSNSAQTETLASVSTPYTIVNRAANSRVWQQTNYSQSPSGQWETNVQSYTELATSLVLIRSCIPTHSPE